MEQLVEKPNNSFVLAYVIKLYSIMYVARTIEPSAGAPEGPRSDCNNQTIFSHSELNNVIRTWLITLSPPQEPLEGPRSECKKETIYFFNPLRIRGS